MLFAKLSAILYFVVIIGAPISQCRTVSAGPDIMDIAERLNRLLNGLRGYDLNNNYLKLANITGPISFGTQVEQINNRGGWGASSAKTDQNGNHYELSNIDGDVNFGSRTVQIGNSYH